MAAATMYVTVAGAGAKTGADWANAFGFTEWKADMKNNAEAGDLYYVYSGTYTGSADWLTSRSGTTASVIRVVGVSDQNAPPTPATGTDRPVIASGAYYFISQGNNWKWESLRATGTGIYGAMSTGAGLVKNCAFTNSSGTADRAGYYAWVLGKYEFIGCESECTNGRAFQAGTYPSFEWCYVKDSKVGFYTGAHIAIRNSTADGCVTGIGITGGLDYFYSVISNNTIYGSTVGLNLNGAYAIVITNNVFDTNTTAISNSSLFTHVESDYNNFHGNTTNRTNVSAGDHDTTDDPQFVNAASGDFTLTSGSPCLSNGMPISLGVASEVATHQGAVPPVEGSGGGGGLLRHPGMTGGLSA